MPGLCVGTMHLQHTRSGILGNDLSEPGLERIAILSLVFHFVLTTARLYAGLERISECEQDASAYALATT